MGRVTASESGPVLEDGVQSAVVEQAPAPSVGRVPGLDTLRFVLASWVVLGHTSFVPVSGLGMEGVYGVFRRLAFNGQMAVMVFFLISGFCIHLPYAHGRRIEPVQFYLRREIRILPPVGIMFVIGAIAKDFSFVGVLWSLVCEEIYYCLYPGISRFMKRYGLRVLLAVSAVVAVGLVAWKVHSVDDDLHLQSYALVWAMCLPIWLLGTLLAENLLVIRQTEVKAWRVWAWRLGFWLLSAMSLSLTHHGLPLPFTVLPLGAVAYFWLRDEIAYFHVSPPPRWLEGLGLASYTLYLCHLLVVSKLHLAEATTLEWLVGMGLLAAFVGVLYYGVERPSHNLARAVARRFDRR